MREKEWACKKKIESTHVRKSVKVEETLGMRKDVGMRRHEHVRRASVCNRIYEKELKHEKGRVRVRKGEKE